MAVSKEAVSEGLVMPSVTATKPTGEVQLRLSMLAVRNQLLVIKLLERRFMRNVLSSKTWHFNLPSEWGSGTFILNGCQYDNGPKQEKRVLWHFVTWMLSAFL